MLEDVKDQVMNASPVLSFQVDNSTDVSSCAQLLVFVRYIHSGDNIEEFPSCKCFLILQSCSGNVCTFISILNMDKKREYVEEHVA